MSLQEVFLVITSRYSRSQGQAKYRSSLNNYFLDNKQAIEKI